VHITLDGFIAGPNGEMNWIKIDEEIFDHIGKRIATTDTALYGRNTYEMMEGYWPTAGNKPNASKHDIEHSAWYKKAHKIVLTKSMKGAELPNTTIISDSLTENVNKIKEAADSEILVFGSPTATHSLLQENLIDGFWLLVNKIVLGEGIPLFKNIKEKSKLKLLSTHQFTSGVTELSYEVEK